MIRTIQRTISGLLRPWFRSRLRSAMRGYRLLRETGRLDTLPLLMRDITRHPLQRPAGKFSRWILGAATPSGEICLRQYLQLRLAGVDLNLSLLSSLARPDGRVVYPLPGEWQDILVAHGIKVARLRSTLLWSGYVLFLIVYGQAESIRILLSARRSDGADQGQPPHAYFVGLAEGNLPRNTGADEGRWNVINWYLQWPDRPPVIREVRHGVRGAKPMRQGDTPVLFQKSPVPPLEPGTIPAYLLWLIGALLICLADLLRGRWWHSVLLNQAAIAAQARQTESNRLARQYLFHNSGWLYRPLWTFELTGKGSECLLYFYSTNCEGFSRNGAPPVPIYGYESMNWPRYVVWDSPQADFVRRVTPGSCTVSLAGEIWFSDAPIPLPSMSSPVLALFDVTPHRASRYRSLGLGEEFYVPEVAVPVVEDVIACAATQGVTVAWKRKRNIGKIAHPSYRNLAAVTATDGQAEIVDADISASALIAKSDLVISTPYTSTALLARNAGKPSAYYDPLSMLDRADPGAHGIPILRGPEELAAWIQANLPGATSESRHD